MGKIVLSDGNSINSRGYKVLLSGMKLDRFNSNPVMLYEHNQNKVIGRWENFSIENNKFVADPVFDEKDELGAEVKRKVDEKFLRGASIGIIVLKMEEVDDVWVVTECELLEASIVSIPADAGAITLYNENREVLNFEQLKLELNNNKQKQEQKMSFKLSGKTIESLSLDTEYTDKDVELAVQEKDNEIARLNAELKTERSAKVTEFLNNAVKVGKIQETERAHYEKLAATDFESVQAILNSKTEVASETLADKVAKSTLSAGREGWDYMKWMKEDSAGLQKLKHENPKEFEELKETLKK